VPVHRDVSASRLVRNAGAAAALLAVNIGYAAPARARDEPPAVAAYVAAWNGDTAALESLLAQNFVDRTSLLPFDRAMFERYIAGWRALIPDLKVSVLERTSAPGREVLRLRFEGTPAPAANLLPVSGGRVQIEQTEWLSIADAKVESRQAFVDEWTLPTEWMFLAPPSDPMEPHVVTKVADLGPGRFLESIAIARDGRLFVSTGLDGGIVTVDVAGKVTPFATVDVGPGGLMMCLAFDRAGGLYATVNSRVSESHGVWRFDASGQGTRIAALPPGSVPNGLAIDDRGNVLVADSFGGVIWSIPAEGGQPNVWLESPLLAPRPLVGRFPGANGLQRTKDDVFVAVSDRSLLLRIPVAEDGSAQAPIVHAAGLPGDDFAIGPDGTLYVTTHPFNTVVRLTPDGRRVVIAGPAQSVVGPTAAAFAADGSLYVATDGGLYRPLPGIPPAASIVRISLR
jgi:sugar lactone lactonase YvrE/predicted ester cyclase